MRPLVVDTSLLVLLVVGLASKDFIAKHKRLREFSVADFTLLTDVLRAYSPIVVTTNVWTEVSNIARQITDPARSKIGVVMRQIIGRSDEAYVSSLDASGREEFLRLGLSDAALLELKPQSIPILTTDLDLFLAAQNAGRASYNFNHMREANRQ
jgi:hypothetical protein